jgi:hypothetical protein
MKGLRPLSRSLPLVVKWFYHQEVVDSLGIIDILSTGFNTVTKRLWLLVLPVALDLFLWLGPKISIAPVIEKMIGTFRAAMEALPPSSGTEVNFSQAFEVMAESLEDIVARTNFLTLLTWNNMGLPSIAGARPINPSTDRIIKISGYTQMLLVQALIMVVGLFITSLFWGMLGQAVRGERLNLGRLLGRAPTYWLYLLAIFAPFGFVLIMAVSLSFLLGPFAPLIWVASLWVAFLISFVPQAVTLAEEKPLRALWSSLTLVRRHFWSALGLVLLSTVIGQGLGLVWVRLMNVPAGTAIAILANAFVGTGLAAAMFVFYRERAMKLPETARELRSA